jgi:thiamine transport system substrate-binding protein
VGPVAGERQFLITVIIVIIILAAIGAAAWWVISSRSTTSTTNTTAATGGGKPTLVVYTYSDFMAWGENPNETWDKVFYEFGRQHNVNVKVVTFDDARTMLTTLIEEAKRGEPGADVVIGVDNLLTVEAKKAGIVDCYFSPIANETVPSSIAEALDPDRCVTPFDYGLIAIVYDPARLNSTELSILEHPTLDDLASLSGKLVVEDPTKSSPGLAFLFWEIAVSEKLEHKDWKSWWSSVANSVDIEPSWSAAFNVFLDKKQGRPIVVSYGTDAAYSAYENNGTPTLRVTLIYSGGKATGWLQVEGVMVVKGSKHPKLAREFVDWLLSRDVQSLVPLNQWMLPANSQVPLPDIFQKYALKITDVSVVANNLFTPEEISSNYESWLQEFLSVVGGAG